MAKKNKLIKSITVDELAVMMNNSFENQTKLMLNGFEKVNEKMDKKFEKMDKKFGEMDIKFGEVFKVLKVMDDKLDDVSSVKNRVNYIENVLNIHPIKN